MNSFKILVFGQIPPPFHGSNLMTSNLLQALGDSNHSYKLVNKVFSINIEEVEKAKFIKIFRIIKVYKEYFNLLINFKPNLLIYFITTKKIGVFIDGVFLITPLILNIPFVLYFHGVGHRNNSNNIFMKIIYKYIFSKSKAFIILSKKLIDDIAFMNVKNIFILPNCIPKSEEIIYSRFYNIDKNKNDSINILFLSHLVESKGVLILLESIPYVLEENSKVKFIFVGSFLRNKFELIVKEFIKNNNLEKYVSFRGSLFGIDKAKILAEADIFVFPSLNESFALVNLEAMYMGIPVISTNVGAISEVIEDGTAGYIIPPKEPKILANNIIKLMKSEGIRKTMGLKGRERYQKLYSYNSYKERLNNIIENLKAN